jgi:hypothetical protein
MLTVGCPELEVYEFLVPAMNLFRAANTVAQINARNMKPEEVQVVIPSGGSRNRLLQQPQTDLLSRYATEEWNLQNRAERTYDSVYLHHIVHVRTTQTRINQLSSLALGWKGVELDLAGGAWRTTNAFLHCCMHVGA